MNKLMKMRMVSNNGYRSDNDKKNREHYDNGRYAPMRSNYDDSYESPYMGHEPRRSWEIIENGGTKHNDYSPSMQYSGETNNDGMTRVLGFSPEYAEYKSPMHEDEMSSRSGSKERGYSNSKAVPPMTREMAEEWMSKLYNEDGTKGAHWTLNQVKQMMMQKGIQGDPIRVWVAMNAEYSDMVAVAKKYALNKPEFYLDSALARWLNDHDAVPDKEAAYYMYVVKH